MFCKNLTFRNPALLFLIIFVGSIFSISCSRRNSHSTRHFDKDGWIGVYVQDIDSDLRRYLDIDVRHGVMVNDIVNDGPAEKSGLQREDVIVRFDGKRIRDTKDLTRAVRRITPGKKVKLEIVRNQEKKQLTISVDEQPSRSYSRHRSRREKRKPRTYSFRGDRRPWLGVHIANLNDDLSSYFDAGKDEGVLVLSVVEESPAEAAGLKAGDIITQINSEKVHNKEELIELISDAEDEQVEITFKRKGDERKVVVELERMSHFDEENWEEWRHGLLEWKDGLREWARGMREWARDQEDWNIHIDLDGLEDLDEEIRRDVEGQIRNQIEINLPLEHLVETLEKNFESIGEDLEKAIEQMGKDLNDLNIRIRLHGYGEVLN